MRAIISEEVCFLVFHLLVSLLCRQDSDRVLVESANSMDSGSDEPSGDMKPKKKPGRKMMTTEPTNV